MRLQDKYILLAEQLRDLYEFSKFINERIAKNEQEIDEIGKLIDFANYLNDSGKDDEVEFSCPATLDFGTEFTI